ncbi:MAG: hypothetical protein HUK16_02800, partial [Bacteroidales bacterium]|nr:hypothetical protein [Bacteroidales bacterium]
MIMGVLFFPKLKLGKVQVDAYWVVALLGALLLILSRQVGLPTVGRALLSNDAINPLKILVLFISMTILSIYLDEFGFFRYLANATLKRAHTSQTKLFLYLYLTVSILTVFTSNDIIILSFTPFICFFAKNARINALPYLAAEFVAANTWSMALVIGNPTNIYLATANGIDFVHYLNVMVLPTLAAGLVAFVLLYLMFRKQLSAPITGEAEDIVITDWMRLALGLVHLGVCTVFLVISSYIHVEMWIVAGCSAVSLFFWAAVLSGLRREVPVGLVACLRRAPWQLIPFVVSMFVMTIALSEKGVTQAIAHLLGQDGSLLKYGIASFLTANIVNNIPMSVLFCSIIDAAQLEEGLKAVYATIIGSNIGAFLTPIGALAGIMWANILNEHGLRFGYRDFLKIGVMIAVPTLLVALGVLGVMV